MKTFLGRMKAKDSCPSRKPMPAILWSWLGSFGAAAVLGYGAPMAEFSQPRHLVVGNLVSSFVGVTVAANISALDSTAFAAALAVSSSALFMHLLRSIHQPGGATALIAVVGGSIRGLGYWYVLFPVLCGTLILLAVAIIVNNLSRNPHRHYPVYWF